MLNSSIEYLSSRGPIQSQRTEEQEGGMMTHEGTVEVEPVPASLEVDEDINAVEDDDSTTSSTGESSSSESSNIESIVREETGLLRVHIQALKAAQAKSDRLREWVIS
ncbi:unnamed protein product [Amoebophrya sp. A25]|nr:unnamed protein product [Amoebophrya sp. A25]|eukprot:GSA25T00010603001.1